MSARFDRIRAARWTIDARRAREVRTMSAPFTRRTLFQSAAAAPLAAAAAPAPAPAPLLPTIKLGQHNVTRLIVGSNPFSGYAYSLPSLSEHMKEWFTPANVAATLRLAEQSGINTHQLGYIPASVDHLLRLKDEGLRLQWLALSNNDMATDPAVIARVARQGPMAIVHHGGVTDRHFRAGEHGKVQDFLKRVRDAGVLVGMSAHLPESIAYAEEHNWDVDFYMASFYQLTRPPEQTRRLAAELPVGTTFLEGDPARMCAVIRAVSKPCLAFKILAAGRVAESRGGLEQAFRFAFDHIKPTDAVIVGMYPRFRDEAAENAAIVRRLLST
jgi:hypothetical protein